VLASYTQRRRNSGPAIGVRTLHGYAVLGGITADQAAQQAMQLTAAYPSKYESQVAAQAQAAQLSYNPAGCSSQPAPNLQLFQTGSSLALGVGGAGLGIATSVGAISSAVGAVAGAVTMGIGSIVGIFIAIFQHHAQAVAKEQQMDCAAVPAANNYLQIIQQAVNSGAQTPQQGIAALQSLLSDFRSAIASTTKMNSSQCDAGCYYVVALTAIVNYWIGQYQDLAAQQAAAAQAAAAAPPPATSSSGPVSTPVVNSGSTLVLPAATATTANGLLNTIDSDLPSWWPIAAAALLFVAFKGGA
jgi:hypothetical protein